MKTTICFFCAINLLMLFSCTDTSKQTDSKNKKSIIAKPQINTNEKAMKLDSINVVSLSENYPEELIELYNADGSIWKSFKFDDDFADKDLRPFSIKTENSVLVFRCVGRKGEYYEVVVNENKKDVKYIKADVKYFNYETWQEHIVKLFSVDFDQKTNPIRKEPKKNTGIIPYDAEQFYHPIEIRGNWLKISDDKDKTGWIQWMDDKDNLLLQFYYEA
ncbi:hypothetical protein [Emticicia fluvialis]|uniref:hypothetical protein n=1 Tax=Emticicia fluvialis TaxID=2974474 RepID=UPI0021664229|nr:hypothetical protein [Emticicia fluvialis]